MTAPGDPLAKRPWVAVEELAGRPWLLREPGSGTRTLCEDWRGGDRAEAAHAGLERRDQAGRPCGPGSGAQSRAAVELELELGLLDTISPRGGLPRRRWHVVRSAVGPVRPEVEAFMAFCASPAARHVLARKESA